MMLGIAAYAAMDARDVSKATRTILAVVSVLNDEFAGGGVIHEDSPFPMLGVLYGNSNDWSPSS